MKIAAYCSKRLSEMMSLSAWNHMTRARMKHVTRHSSRSVGGFDERCLLVRLGVKLSGADKFDVYFFLVRNLQAQNNVCKSSWVMSAVNACKSRRVVCTHQWVACSVRQW